MMQSVKQNDLFEGTNNGPAHEDVANDNYTKWQKFHRDNPHVYQLIKRFTKQAIESGFKHYGMQTVIERVRWHTMIETQGDQLKINNNHGPYYARLWMQDHPENAGFFHTRSSSARRVVND